MINLLKILNCWYVDKLCHSQTATYNSETTANDMLESIATAIRKTIDSKLLRFPFISVFADESTDISVHKKLVYARCVYPDTFIPSTHFIANVRVESGTGEVIAQEIQNCLKSRNFDISNVMGFGSD